MDVTRLRCVFLYVTVNCKSIYELIMLLQDEVGKKAHGSLKQKVCKNFWLYPLYFECVATSVKFKASLMPTMYICMLPFLMCATHAYGCVGVCFWCSAPTLYWITCTITTKQCCGRLLILGVAFRCVCRDRPLDLDTASLHTTPFRSCFLRVLFPHAFWVFSVCRRHGNWRPLRSRWR
jgi:hypothetical protein